MDRRNERLSIDLRRDGEIMADLTGKMHQLPCCIKYSGLTSVFHYFKPKPSGEMEVDGLRVEEAYFRGMKLHHHFPFPRAILGPCWGRKALIRMQTVQVQTAGRCATFENLTIWNHDVIPSKEDTFLLALHWFPVAQAWHQPVSVEDVESTCTE